MNEGDPRGLLALCREIKCSNAQLKVLDHVNKETCEYYPTANE